MVITPIKRDKYLLGDFWKDRKERIWKIIGISDSKYGSVFRVVHGDRRVTLSLDSLNALFVSKV